MERKLDKLLDLMKAKNWDKALSLASKWPRLGEEREAIIAAHSANTNKDFYRQIKKDPEALVQAGIEALIRRYGHLLSP